MQLDAQNDMVVFTTPNQRYLDGFALEAIGGIANGLGSVLGGIDGLANGNERARINRDAAVTQANAAVAAAKEQRLAAQAMADAEVQKSMNISAAKSAEKKDGPNLLLWGGVGAGVLVLVGVILFFVMRKSK